MHSWKLAIAAPFRDETRYLREWIEYHRLVGVEHCILMCNDDLEEHGAVSDVLGPYVDEGFVSWDIFSDRSPTWQLSCWQHILAEYGPQCEWLCLTDLDAFLYPVQGMRVPELLAPYDQPDVAGLAVYVCVFGSNGLLESPALQVEALTQRGPLHCPANWTANYVLRPDRLVPADLVLGYCLPKPGYRLVRTDGTTCTPGKFDGPKDILRLNHYSIRSRSAWLRKISRGWPECAKTWTDQHNKVEDHKWAMNDRNEVLDEGMLRFVPQLKAALSTTRR